MFDIFIDKLQNENSQQVGDLQIKLGEQEDKLLAQKNEIKRLREQLEEKEAHITELVATIETKESLLAEALNTTTAQENHDNDMQVLHSHRDDTTETNTEVDTKATSVSTSNHIWYTGIYTICARHRVPLCPT